MEEIERVPIYMMGFGQAENICWMSATVLRMQQNCLFEYPKELKSMESVCA